MIEVSESEARELLWQVLDQSEFGYTGDREEVPTEAVITMVCHAVSGATVPACPVCNEPESHCRCNSEAEDVDPEISDEEVKEFAEELAALVQEEGGELEFDDGTKVLIEREGYGFCPVCDQQRLEDLLIKIEDSEQVVGCTFCLDKDREAVGGEDG